MLTDKNGLELSESSESGYRLVSVYNGKYVAYATVYDEDLKKMNKKFGNMCDFFGYDNVVALGDFDDPRDAAYVAQVFDEDRDPNLEFLLNEGDVRVIPEPPQHWNHSAV